MSSDGDGGDEFLGRRRSSGHMESRFSWHGGHLTPMNGLYLAHSAAQLLHWRSLAEWSEHGIRRRIESIRNSAP
jgi:hypothetical protein